MEYRRWRVAGWRPKTRWRRNARRTSAPVGLLAAMACAVTACGGNSHERKVSAVLAQGRSYRTSTKEAAAVLARLRVPDGFEPARHCTSQYGVCFTRPKSVVPSRAEMIRRVMALGASIVPATTRCSRANHSPVPRLAFLVCSARATSGSDLLFVTLTSVVVVTPTTPRGTERALRGGQSGSTIKVIDIGH